MEYHQSCEDEIITGEKERLQKLGIERLLPEDRQIVEKIAGITAFPLSRNEKDYLEFKVRIPPEDRTNRDPPYGEFSFVKIFLRDKDVQGTTFSEIVTIKIKDIYEEDNIIAIWELLLDTTINIKEFEKILDPPSLKLLKLMRNIYCFAKLTYDNNRVILQDLDSLDSLPDWEECNPQYVILYIDHLRITDVKIQDFDFNFSDRIYDLCKDYFAVRLPDNLPPLEKSSKSFLTELLDSTISEAKYTNIFYSESENKITFQTLFEDNCLHIYIKEHDFDPNMWKIEQIISYIRLSPTIIRPTIDRLIDNFQLDATHIKIKAMDMPYRTYHS